MRIILTLTALALALTIGCLCGETANAATNIIVPGVVKTDSVSGGDLDAYEFMASAGDSVTVSMGNIIGVGTFQPTVSLLGPGRDGSGFGTGILSIHGAR